MKRQSYTTTERASMPVGWAAGQPQIRSGSPAGQIPTLTPRIIPLCSPIPAEPSLLLLLRTVIPMPPIVAHWRNTTKTFTNSVWRKRTIGLIEIKIPRRFSKRLPAISRMCADSSSRTIVRSCSNGESYQRPAQDSQSRNCLRIGNDEKFCRHSITPRDSLIDSGCSSSQASPRVSRPRWARRGDR